ncbi:MAG: extracellular solute-binding protein, partial [Chloroflexi bacterium]|nr:extracellular solute-binding protein [Chloroflexota bacterium]
NKAVLNEAVSRFEKANPGSKVEITWYQKNELNQALRGNFQAGQGPDVFYFDTDALEFIEGGFLADLSGGIRWDNVHPWAKEFWTRAGPGGKQGAWALPLEATTEELYYNKQTFSELGITVPPSLRFDEAQFADVVQKCTAGGKDAFAVGVGDRPYPGTYVTNYLLLSKLGAEDLGDLWTGGGKVTWKDPRVQEVLGYHKRLVDMKAYPTSISSLKLGEAHRYFHTEQKACMMPVGSWYTSRSFLPVDNGGQPQSFQLGMLNYPTVKDGAGTDLKFQAIGGSVAVNAKGKNVDQATTLVNVLADPEMGNFWSAKTSIQTGIKTDPSKIQNDYSWYFGLYADTNKSIKPVVLNWQAMMKPGMKEAYTQIMNSAFPAGLVSVSDATEKLEQARASGR